MYPRYSSSSGWGIPWAPVSEAQRYSQDSRLATVTPILPKGPEIAIERPASLDLFGYLPQPVADDLSIVGRERHLLDSDLEFS